MEIQERVFTEMWLRERVPRPSLDAFDDTEVGTLRVARGHLSFKANARTFEVLNITAVRYGREGHDFINRWIRVEYVDGPHSHRVYLKDGAWRGWRPILTRSNAAILTAIREATLGNPPITPTN